MAEDQDKNYGPEVTKQLSMKHKQGTLLCARKEDSVRAEWLNLLPFSSWSGRTISRLLQM